MADIYKKFIEDSNVIAFDPDHRRKINFNIGKYDEALPNGEKQFIDLENAKQRAANIKHRIINELDKYLIEFERNFTAKGGKVIWVQNKREAIKEILGILRHHKAKKVVKSKTMTSEEIDLNDALEKNKIEVLETDLGEFIVQLAGEKPYHIVTPAMHKSKEEVAKLYNEKFGTPIDSTPEEITLFTRHHLKEKFINADVGITGANFLIADTGSVALTENEGNQLMTFSFPKVHISIAGIEKLIPSLESLDLFWPLLSSHGTGQQVTVYNSIISGPRRNNEVDGPEEMYVILMDNNRTELMKRPEQRSALSCIRCGACLNGCPVYKNIGGYTYNTTYSGPIGSVISPFFKGLREYNHLSYASTLCGKCTEVCPVKINLHELLLHNRNEGVRRKHPGFKERLIIKGWTKTMKKRSRMDFFGPNSKNKALKYFFKKEWGPRRDLPLIKQKSFRELWMENKNNKAGE